MRRLQLVLAIGLAILVSACNSAPITIPPLSEADIPEMNAAANFPHERYRLEPGDAIQIRYTHHPEMSQDDMVRPDGKINAKLVGPIEVAGLTKNELAKMLSSGRLTSSRTPRSSSASRGSATSSSTWPARWPGRAPSRIARG